MKFCSRPRTMRRELAIYIAVLSLATAVAFTQLLMTYFERGLENAAEFIMLMEVRTFDRNYRHNPDTPLPSAHTLQFFLDDPSTASALLQKAIPFAELEPGEFLDVEWDEYADEEESDNWQDWKGYHFLTAYLHILPDGKKLYAISDLEPMLLTREEQRTFDVLYYRVFVFGGLYLLLMLLLIVFYNFRVNRHTRQLAVWADGLSLDSIEKSHPDFHYAELNGIADQLIEAFKRIASLLEREHQFLRHASHELRTPIAVIRANMELLERMPVPSVLERPINRVRRANHGMLQLTETLLWLSRENATAPMLREVRIDSLLDEISEDLLYLLQDKQIELKRDYEEDIAAQQLPETPLRIVLANLLRNAFQYTQEGDVMLKASNQHLVIQNRDLGEDSINSDESFGLGLMLVHQICKRLNWDLTLQPLGNGIRAELVLPAPELQAVPAGEHDQKV
ncbi:sensor histidine kinase [Endozoicomonadaceae bacterium StTr2]